MVPREISSSESDEQRFKEGFICEQILKVFHIWGPGCVFGKENLAQKHRSLLTI